MEAATLSQYKRSFHKFEDALQLVFSGHGPSRAHAHLVFVGGARISCLLLFTHTPTRRGRPSGRPALCRAERGLHLLSRKPPSLSLPQTVANPVKWPRAL